MAPCAAVLTTVMMVCIVLGGGGDAHPYAEFDQFGRVGIAASPNSVRQDILQLIQAQDKALDKRGYMAEKRGCIQRSCNINDCCNGFACRCSILGTNCRCQVAGIIQRLWGKK